MNSTIRRLLLIGCVTGLLTVPVMLVARSNQQKLQENPALQEAQSLEEKTKQHKKEIPPPYGFSEQTPPGDWAAIAEFDVNQKDDPYAMAIIVGLASYGGKGQWAKQLMVQDVTIRNRSTSVIKSIKLGWIIITAEDRQAKKNRSAALREGFTERMPVAILPDKLGKLRDLHIDFVKEAKDLIRTGKITGLTFIRLRVAEVEFDNGFIWKEGPAMAIRMHHSTPRVPAPPSGCADRICFFEENGQGYCSYSSPGTYCRRENCSPNDPNACFCNVYDCTNCHDGDGDGWTDCEGDCDDGDVEINPGRFEYYPIEHCTDGVDNDCELDTPSDCEDSICQLAATSCGAPESCPASCNEPDPDLFPKDVCAYFNEGGCPYPSYPASENSSCCRYPTGSPILVDIEGNGFRLTNVVSGVNFDLDSNGSKELLSWTLPDSDDAWLVLDRNSNGIIDSGIELFGDYTPQPQPSVGLVKNGFAALAEYDKTQNGGNNDRQITSADTIFSTLKLWQDRNHNGISEQVELQSLTTSNIKSIDLEYKTSKRVDEHGNQFRFRAQVKDLKGTKTGRWAWDVFLIKAP